MTVPVVVTRARGDEIDRTAIAAIDEACFRHGTINLAAELERPWAHVWAARLGGEWSPPAAFLVAWAVADELHILSVGTLPVHRRTGLARALMVHAIDFARSRRADVILLEVRRSNEPAIRLYRGLGFSAIGIREQYYADNLEDAIEMALMLDPFTGQIIPGRDDVSLEES
jgi:[ribosomal protein S18]-alanine N-acetyltransferase